MSREVNRGADTDGHPRPQPAPSPSPSEGSNVYSLRDRVSFPSSSSRPRPSCWGRLRIRRIGRIQSRTIRTGSSGDEHDTRAASCGDRGRLCACGCSGNAGAGAAAVGPRTLLQRNDFYCDDCNPHRMENQMKEGSGQSVIMSSSVHAKRADMAQAKGNVGSKKELSVFRDARGNVISAHLQFFFRDDILKLLRHVMRMVEGYE